MHTSPLARPLFRPIHLALTVLVAIGCGDPLPPARAEPEKAAEEASISLEEDGQTFFVQLAKTNLAGFEFYSSVRLIPWRRVEKGAVTDARVRLSLGYGTGLDKQTRQALGDNAMAGFFGLAMNQFEERLWFQVTADDLEQILRLCDRIEKIELKEPAPVVKWRVLEASWGDLKLRKADDGYYIFVPGDPGGWEPLPLERFRAAIRKASSDLKELVAAKPSATW